MKLLQSQSSLRIVGGKRETGPWSINGAAAFLVTLAAAGCGGKIVPDGSVLSEGQPLAQAQALETSLIQQAHAEGRLIYNVAPQSISPFIPVQVPSTVMPSQTLLNPALYPH